MAKLKHPVATKATETRNWITEEDMVLICEAWEEYKGTIDVFESAIGALLLGRFIGYDALRLIHKYRTLRNYEKILKGISFKERLPARTPDTMRVYGMRLAENFKQFWKAVAAGVGSEPGARNVGDSASAAL